MLWLLWVMKMPEGLSWVTFHGQQNENYMPMPSVKGSQTTGSPRAPEVSSEVHHWQSSRFCRFRFMIFIVSFSLPFPLSLSFYLHLLSLFLFFSISILPPHFSLLFILIFSKTVLELTVQIGHRLAGVFVTLPPKGSSWRCAPPHPAQRICPWWRGPVSF